MKEEISFQICLEIKISQKDVLIGTTHIEPRSVNALSETTFLVTYFLEILAEDIGSAIEKINE